MLKKQLARRKNLTDQQKNLLENLEVLTENDLSNIANSILIIDEFTHVFSQEKLS